MSPPAPDLHLYLGSENCGTIHRWLDDPFENNTESTGKAWLDATMRLPSLSPPGTMALAVRNEHGGSMRPLRIVERCFSGILSPSTAPDVFLTRIAFLLERARHQPGIDHVRLDVPPALGPAGGAAWLPSLLNLTTPARITAIARTEQHSGLTRLLTTLTGVQPNVLLPDLPERRKSPEERALLFAGKISKALDDTVVREVDPSLTVQVGTCLGNGATLPPQRCQWASTALGIPICRGDWDDRGVLTLWTTVPGFPSGWDANASWAAESLGASKLRVVSFHFLNGLIVGLHGHDRSFRCLGKLEGWDLDKDALRIRMPPSIDPNALGFVEWGRFRVGPDGRLFGRPAQSPQKRGTMPDAGVYFG